MPFWKSANLGLKALSPLLGSILLLRSDSTQAPLLCWEEGWMSNARESSLSLWCVKELGSGECPLPILPPYSPPPCPPHHPQPCPHLDDLPFFKGKLLFRSIWVWGHGEGVVVKKSHKDPGWELFRPRVRLWLFIEVWRKPVPPTVLIWERVG